MKAFLYTIIVGIFLIAVAVVTGTMLSPATPSPYGNLADALTACKEDLAAEKYGEPTDQTWMGGNSYRFRLPATKRTGAGMLTTQDYYCKVSYDPSEGTYNVTNGIDLD